MLCDSVGPKVFGWYTTPDAYEFLVKWVEPPTTPFWCHPGHQFYKNLAWAQPGLLGKEVSPRWFGVLAITYNLSDDILEVMPPLRWCQFSSTVTNSYLLGGNTHPLRSNDRRCLHGQLGTASSRATFPDCRSDQIASFCVDRPKYSIGIRRLQVQTWYNHPRCY